MAQKKPAGLGRGLGDLLEDNTPVIKGRSATVIIRAEDGNKNMQQTADLYDGQKKPKNKSLKANFR